MLRSDVRTSVVVSVLSGSSSLSRTPTLSSAKRSPVGVLRTPGHYRQVRYVFRSRSAVCRVENRVSSLSRGRVEHTPREIFTEMMYAIQRGQTSKQHDAAAVRPEVPYEIAAAGNGTGLNADRARRSRHGRAKSLRFRFDEPRGPLRRRDRTEDVCGGARDNSTRSRRARMMNALGRGLG